MNFAKLGLHPFAVQAVLREHQQQAVVDLDGPVDLLAEFLAPRHVFRSEPDPQLFATQLRVQPPSELIVLLLGAVCFVFEPVRGKRRLFVPICFFCEFLTHLC